MADHAKQRSSLGQNDARDPRFMMDSALAARSGPAFGFGTVGA